MFFVDLVSKWTFFEFFIDFLQNTIKLSRRNFSFFPFLIILQKVMVFGTDINLNSEILDGLIKESTAASSSRTNSKNNLRKALRSQRR